MSIKRSLILTLGLAAFLAGCSQPEPEPVIVVEPEPEFQGKF